MIKIVSTNFIGDAVRFLLAGGLNTILSYLVYLLLNLVVSYQIAYALSWVFGLLFIVIFYCLGVPLPLLAGLAFDPFDGASSGVFVPAFEPGEAGVSFGAGSVLLILTTGAS